MSVDVKKLSVNNPLDSAKNPLYLAKLSSYVLGLARGPGVETDKLLKEVEERPDEFAKKHPGDPDIDEISKDMSTFLRSLPKEKTTKMLIFENWGYTLRQMAINTYCKGNFTQGIGPVIENFLKNNYHAQLSSIDSIDKNRLANKIDRTADAMRLIPSEINMAFLVANRLNEIARIIREG